MNMHMNSNLTYMSEKFFSKILWTCCKTMMAKHRYHSITSYLYYSLCFGHCKNKIIQLPKTLKSNRKRAWTELIPLGRLRWNDMRGRERKHRGRGGESRKKAKKSAKGTHMTVDDQVDIEMQTYRGWRQDQAAWRSLVGRATWSGWRWEHLQTSSRDNLARDWRTGRESQHHSEHRRPWYPSPNDQSCNLFIIYHIALADE